MYVIGDADLFFADVLLPYRGTWTAEVTCTPDATFVVGDTIDMSLGSLEFRGTVLRGSALVDPARFFLVGGAGGWRKTVKRRFYKDANGIKLSQVLRDLATDSGETIELVDSLSSKIVGDTWTRAESTASDCLVKLGVQWRVRPDGVTVVGPSPVLTPTKTFSIKSFDAALGTAIVQFQDESMDELLPDTYVDEDGFQFTCRNVRFVVQSGSVYARVNIT